MSPIDKPLTDISCSTSRHLLPTDERHTTFTRPRPLCGVDRLRCDAQRSGDSSSTNAHPASRKARRSAPRPLELELGGQALGRTRTPSKQVRGSGSSRRRDAGRSCPSLICCHSLRNIQFGQQIAASPIFFSRSPVAIRSDENDRFVDSFFITYRGTSMWSLLGRPFPICAYIRTRTPSALSETLAAPSSPPIPTGTSSGPKCLTVRQMYVCCTNMLLQLSHSRIPFHVARFDHMPLRISPERYCEFAEYIRYVVVLADVLTDRSSQIIIHLRIFRRPPTYNSLHNLNCLS